MKTLIIHPADPSTDFLKPIYSGVSDATIITGGVSKSDVALMIDNHERIMMMGHGSPFGLFAVGKWMGTFSYIIDHTMVPLLKKKQNNVFIWCNAYKFLKSHDLKGFCSDMFISEVTEAMYCGLPNMNQEVVTESNNYFAQSLGEIIAGEPLGETYHYIKEKYGVLAKDNPVAYYNWNRLHLM